MRIAFLYDCIYPFRIGGVEHRVWEISRRMVQRGHEVHLLGMKFWEGPDVIGREGVVIHGVCPAPGLPDLYTGGRRAILPAFRYSASLLRPLLNGRFDVIDAQHFPYLHCFPAAAVARATGASLVITWHEVWDRYWSEYLGAAGFLGRCVERAVARIPAHLTAVSATTRDQLRRIQVTKPVTIIPNGIDARFLASVAPSSGAWDLIFAGRLIPEKRVDLLLEAVAIIRPDYPALSVLVLGDGPERERLEQQAEELGISGNLAFRDFTRDPAEFAGILKSGKVFVSPSVREGFGMTALEAMGCGIPVVTVNHPRNAVRELVTPATGCVADPDPASLAAAICSCLSRSSAYHDGCIQAAGAYDWDGVVRDLERYYEDVTGGKFL